MTKKTERRNVSCIIQKGHGLPRKKEKRKGRSEERERDQYMSSTSSLPAVTVAREKRGRKKREMEGESAKEPGIRRRRKAKEQFNIHFKRNGCCLLLSFDMSIPANQPLYPW